MTGTGTTTSYIWGLDLRKTLQGAGGVGGLLVQSIDDGSTVNRFCAASDANGNITDYITKSGAVAARFEYDAFWNVTDETISSPFTASTFPFRFSSKYQDLETGLNYYGYRYYSPELGRWLNRDPIGEKGGLNVYGFVGNKAIDQHDLLGLCEFTCKPCNKCDKKGEKVAEADGECSRSFDLYPYACAQHDKCYSSKRSTKRECDDQFLKDMLLETGTTTAMGVLTAEDNKERFL